MRKTIVKVLILTAICILSFAGCDSQNGVADNSASVNPTTGAASTVENGSTAKPTETKKEPTKAPTTTEPTKGPTVTIDPTTGAASTVENGSTAKPTETKKEPTKAPTTTTEPTKVPSVTTSETTVKPIVTDSPTKTPATSTSEPTKVPSVTTSEPTKAPATSTTEPTKGPTVTIDPTKDYSEWGKHGFEDLLPIPLPFSDEEADWRSKKETQKYFKVKNFKMIYFKNPDDFVSAIKEYAESYESLGYTIISEQYKFTVYSLEIGLFRFICSANGYVSIEITLA